MTHFREQWEGVSLSGNYTLERWLDGDESAAFFQTSPGSDGRRAVVKLVPGAIADSNGLFDLWQRTRQLRHPNLIELFECGRAGSPRRNGSLRGVRISRRYARLRAQAGAAQCSGIARGSGFGARCSSLPARPGTGARGARCGSHRCGWRWDQACHRHATRRGHFHRVSRRRALAGRTLAAGTDVGLAEELADCRSCGGSESAVPLDAG